MIVYGELGRMWKEAVMACFKILSHYLLGENKENHETLEWLASRLRTKPRTLQRAWRGANHSTAMIRRCLLLKESLKFFDHILN
jgi:hypothetical protein